MNFAQHIFKAMATFAIAIAISVALDFWLWSSWIPQNAYQAAYSSFHSPLQIKHTKVNTAPYNWFQRFSESCCGGGEPLVQIKIAFCALNPVDSKMHKGYFRLLNHRKRVGFDFSGVVMKRYKSDLYDHIFKVGDRVCGMLPLRQMGAVCECIDVPESWLARVPYKMTLVEAATVPMACLTAAYMVSPTLTLDYYFKRPPLKVLVLGGGTSVGRMAIQIIRSYKEHCGIWMVASDSKRNQVFAEEYGVQLVDRSCTQGWWAKLNEKDFVLVVDAMGGLDTWKRGKLFLHKEGKYVTCVGDEQVPFTLGELGKRAWRQISRANYDQVVCWGGDGATLMDHIRYVRGNPRYTFPFSEEGMHHAFKTLDSSKRQGKVLIELTDVHNNNHFTK